MIRMFSGVRRISGRLKGLVGLVGLGLDVLALFAASRLATEGGSRNSQKSVTFHWLIIAARLLSVSLVSM